MKEFPPYVSVVISVYNGEEFIEKAIQSVLAQTLENIEIIIVDDASFDSTMEIIKKYSKNDPRITIIKNDVNRGSGYTKNHAVAAAKGEYVGFVDADDYVDSDFFEKLYTAAKKFDADIACTDIVLEYPDRELFQHIFENNYYLLSQKKVKKTFNKPMKLRGEIVAGHWSGASACTKMLRRKYLLNFPFWEGICDDIPAMFPAVAGTRNIVYIPNLYYHYVQRKGSLEHSDFNKSRLGAADSIAEATQRLLKTKNGLVFAKLLYCNNVYSLLMKIIEMRDPPERRTYLKEFLNRLKCPQETELLDLHSNIYLQEILKLYSSKKSSEYRKIIKLFSQGKMELINKKMDEKEKRWLSFCPKVSIIIPVYNGANYMREAIDSALAQTYANIEVIVVNDGSRDGGETEKIALSYGDRIKYFYKENGGVSTALNLGIEKMTGEYFSWLSHDDMYTEDKIEKQIEEISELEDKTTIMLGGYTVVDKNGRYQYDVNPLCQYTQKQLDTPLFALFRGCINGCALLIHKSHFQRVGCFDPSLPSTQDYDMWFRMMRRQNICFHEGLYVKSRSHDEQGSRNNMLPYIKECDTLWIMMMRSLTDQEKCELDGSLFLFYHNVYRFLKMATSYHKATAFAQAEAYKEARKALVNNQFPVSSERKSILRFLEDTIGFMDDDIKKSEIGCAIRSSKILKRIAFFMGDRNILGGLNRVVLQIAGGLCEDYDVYLITYDKQTSQGFPADSRVKQIVFPYSDAGESYQNKLANLLSFLDIDLFVGSYNCVSSWLCIYEKLHNMGIQTIAWNHEFYFLPYWNSKYHECLSVKNKALEQADAAVWLNSFSANAYALLHQNAAIMPNPVTVSQPDGINIDNRPQNIIAVGRFDDPQKGLAELLYTFADILKEFEDTQLAIVGPYDLKLQVPDQPNITYKQLIQKLGLPHEKLIFTGWVKDVESYYKKSCIHLMPSRYEGFGLAITEAAAYGIPSVIFAGSGLDDIITDGVDGFIVSQGDTAEMAKKAVGLLKDSSRLQSMSKAACSIVKRYEVPKIIGRWKKLIEAVFTMQKDELNQYLQKEFMYPVKDKDAFYQQLANEYESCVVHLCESNQLSYHLDSVSGSMGTDGKHLKELLAIQQSLSWRITKPLRWAKKLVASLHKNGVRITLKKIKNKIRQKIHS